MKIYKFFTFCLILLSLTEAYSQIKIHELNASNLAVYDSLASSFSSTRKILVLNKGWKAYSESNPGKQVRITVPSTFTGADELIYETELKFTENEINFSRIYLHCLGIGYSAEFILNDNIIYKIRGAEIPMQIRLPQDLLYSGTPNKLLIKVSYNLDPKSTIPSKPGFLSGNSTKGILRDLYVEIIPFNGFNSFNVTASLSNDLLKGRIRIDSEEGFLFDKSGYNPEKGKISLQVDVFETGNEIALFSFSNLQADTLKNKLSFELNSPKLWSPESPLFYTARFRLYEGSVIVDEVIRKIAFLNLKKEKDLLRLNNTPLELKGVFLNLTDGKNGQLLPYQKIVSYLKQVKSIGFNAVKFSKNIPDPNTLDFCLEVGLLVFVEAPINSIPEKIAESDSYKETAMEYLDTYCNYLNDFPSIAAIGSGSGFLADSPEHIDLIEKLSAKVKQKTNKFTYASFIGIPSYKVDGLDFYGIELYSKLNDSYTEEINSAINQFGAKSLLFSEVIYPAFNGSTNGYSNPNSFEAQAKFFETIIDYSRSNKFAGQFITSMFDYTGDYISFYAGYDENAKYKIGIFDENGLADRITSKVISARYMNTEKIIIPLGKHKEETPIFFILISLLLSILLAVLINSKRKFREDATRALLRPYNFYADIRDNRILTGFHSLSLMIILAAIHSLLFTNILYFFRANIFFEKLILALNNDWITNWLVTLAWSPVSTFFELFLFAILLFFVISLLIKFASFFIKNRVSFASIFIIVIWSFLPVVLLLPVELILYKVLTANLINPYIYALFIIYALWLLQRLLKGTYVIFDVAPYKVFGYGILIIAITLFGIIVYNQYFNSTIYYIINAYKQYQLM